MKGQPPVSITLINKDLDHLAKNAPIWFHYYISLLQNDVFQVPLFCHNTTEEV